MIVNDGQFYFLIRGGLYSKWSWVPGVRNGNGFIRAGNSEKKLGVDFKNQTPSHLQQNANL